jgi:holliday junction resolvase YEN1
VSNHRILKEISPSKRAALSKLAIDHFTCTSTPLKVAVDISIWSFQVQRASGGSNANIRTLYRRLLNLLRLPLYPLFVFDGPYKPPFKRGKSTITYSQYDVDKPTKDLLDLFGLPWHVAPGEAEAECANFQKNDVVDVVLSEDSDTLMFGSRYSFLNWSSEEAKGNKAKTHVDVYDDKKLKESHGLDSDGMILVALMSGGDYIPAGIPDCGPKAAIQAAKGGFGAELCKLGANDKDGLAAWKARLRHELDTNESGYFKTKHPKLQIPEEFPDMTVLRYYTNPRVSSLDAVQDLKRNIVWDGDIDVHGLRDYVARMFEWRYKSGARTFMRSLAGPLLIHALRRRATSSSIYGSCLCQKIGEEGLIHGPDKEKSHFDNDGATELRVRYVPVEVVDIDLAAEEDNPPNSEGLGEWDDLDQGGDVENDQLPASPKKTARKTFWNPSEPQELWVFEAILEGGAPNLMSKWELGGRQPPPKPSGTSRAGPEKKSTAGDKRDGNLTKFLAVTKRATTPSDGDPQQKGHKDALKIVSTPTKLRPPQPASPSKRTTPFKASKWALPKNQMRLNFATSSQSSDAPSASQKLKRTISSSIPERDEPPRKTSGSFMNPIPLLSSSPLHDPTHDVQVGLPSPLTNRRRVRQTTPVRDTEPPSSSPLPTLHSLFGARVAQPNA